MIKQLRHRKRVKRNLRSINRYYTNRMPKRPSEPKQAKRA